MIHIYVVYTYIKYIYYNNVHIYIYIYICRSLKGCMSKHKCACGYHRYMIRPTTSMFMDSMIAPINVHSMS